MNVNFQLHLLKILFASSMKWMHACLWLQHNMIHIPFLFSIIQKLLLLFIFSRRYTFSMRDLVTVVVMILCSRCVSLPACPIRIRCWPSSISLTSKHSLALKKMWTSRSSGNFWKIILIRNLKESRSVLAEFIIFFSNSVHVCVYVYIYICSYIR